MADFFLTDLVEPRPSIDLELILDPSRRQRKRENSSGNRLLYLISQALQLSACSIGLSF